MKAHASKISSGKREGPAKDYYTITGFVLEVANALSGRDSKTKIQYSDCDKYSKELITSIGNNFLDGNKPNEAETQRMVNSLWAQMDCITNVRGFIFKLYVDTISWLAEKMKAMEIMQQIIFICCRLFVQFLQEEMKTKGDSHCVMTSSFVFIREFYEEMINHIPFSKDKADEIIRNLRAEFVKCANKKEAIQVSGLVCADQVHKLYDENIKAMKNPADIAINNISRKKAVDHIEIKCPFPLLNTKRYIKSQAHDCKFKKKKSLFNRYAKSEYLERLMLRSREIVQNTALERNNVMKKYTTQYNTSLSNSTNNNNNGSSSSSSTFCNLKEGSKSVPKLDKDSASNILEDAKFKKMLTLDMTSLMEAVNFGKEGEFIFPSDKSRNSAGKKSVDLKVRMPLSSRQSYDKKKMKRRSMFRDDNKLELSGSTSTSRNSSKSLYDTIACKSSLNTNSPKHINLQSIAIKLEEKNNSMPPNSPNAHFEFIDMEPTPRKQITHKKIKRKTDNPIDLMNSIEQIMNEGLHEDKSKEKVSVNKKTKNKPGSKISDLCDSNKSNPIHSSPASVPKLASAQISDASKTSSCRSSPSTPKPEPPKCPPPKPFSGLRTSKSSIFENRKKSLSRTSDSMKKNEDLNLNRNSNRNSNETKIGSSEPIKPKRKRGNSSKSNSRKLSSSQNLSTTSSKSRSRSSSSESKTVTVSNSLKDNRKSKNSSKSSLKRGSDQI